ncbi:hypothetical protein [Paenibacillus sedimenti]|uniref:Uncharacterized protein n=1 Tax=Paenibacillus sedimenti TaxID=2770274 RepID=A0A926QIF9_9BACL|nr:hypothetical protein [Paenibacillus sedimenti]MBD0379494.1 hypothetical protein [Paenibacillus sedimenti]
MLIYTYNDKEVEISETANGQDVEFRIRVIGEGSMDKRIKEVQQDFEHNSVLTDVLFYAYLNHEYQFIVRQDYYSEFILSLMKHRILISVTWTG